MPNCRRVKKVDDAIARSSSTHFITKAFNDYMNAKPGKCSVMMGLYHGRYQVTDASPHFAGDGSRIDSHRWYASGRIRAFTLGQREALTILPVPFARRAAATARAAVQSTAPLFRRW